MLGVGSYGEVRYGYEAVSGVHVAVKVLELSRAAAAAGGGAGARQLVERERAVQRSVQGRHCARLVELSADTAHYTGHWCSECACTGSALTAAAAADAATPPTASAPPPTPPPSSCLQCAHPTSCHSSPTSRPVTLIAQELAAGGELFSLLSHTGPMVDALARYYFHQLIDGVASLHSANIVHRDLKPENLALDHTFDLKLVDFGLSTRRKPPRTQPPTHAQPSDAAGEEVDDDDEGVDWAYAARLQQALASAALQDPHDDGTCMHLTGVGSQPYSAPEAYYRDLYSHRPYKGAPADLWSCGVILYVLLTGQPPFLRPLTRTYGSLKRDPHFIALMKGEYDGRISAEARELLQNLLRVHPDDRWSIAQVQRSRWWRGPLMDREQVVREMKRRSELTFTLMDKPHLLQLLQHLREEDSHSRAAHGHTQAGDSVIEAPTTTPPQRSSSPIAINPTASSAHPPPPSAAASARPPAPASLQPVCSSSDSSPGQGKELPSRCTPSAAPSAVLLTAPSSPSLLSVLPAAANHATASSITARPHQQPQHTSTLPSPVHHRHEQQQQLPAQSAVARTAAVPPSSSPATAAAAVDRSPLSSGAAYRSYFRSARPPVAPPLSLTAQSQLKPTSWGRRDSHSLSHSRSARGRGGDTAEAEEREEEGEDIDNDDDGDTDGEEEAVEDVDAGYENDSDTSSEEAFRDEHAEQPSERGEEKHGQ